MIVAGSIRLDGTLTAGGGEAVRQITSTGGDIFVSGSLRGGEVGGAARGLTLNAPQGTVYVAGSIDTAGRSAGQGGGAIVITAQRVVLLGAVGNGADGAAGGSGGPIAIAAADLVFVGGTGAGCAAAWGRPPAVRAGTLVDRHGGRGAGRRTRRRARRRRLRRHGDSGLGGAIKVGERRAPSLVNLSMTLSRARRHGRRRRRQGWGGDVEPQDGNLVIAGSVDFGGGCRGAQPGDGGTFVGRAGAGVGDDPVERRRRP